MSEINEGLDELWLNLFSSAAAYFFQPFFISPYAFLLTVLFFVLRSALACLLAFVDVVDERVLFLGHKLILSKNASANEIARERATESLRISERSWAHRDSCELCTAWMAKRSRSIRRWTFSLAARYFAPWSRFGIHHGSGRRMKKFTAIAVLIVGVSASPMAFAAETPTKLRAV